MVSPDHDRIEELLAGYVLLGLTGEDAEEADLLLSEHVPSCALCREALSGFQSVAGELGLAAPPAAPPDLLLPRIRRELEQPAVRRHRGVSFVAVAASVALLVGLAGLSFSLGNRVSKAEAQRGTLLEAVSAMQQSGTNPVALENQGSASGGLAEISAPNIQHMYIFGQEVAPPAPGHAYQLWLGSNGTFVPAGEMFTPEDGRVVLELTFDPSPYDSILITEEAAGATPSTPSSSLRWSASLVPAA
jgi:hypothetical protein